jgi:hypothetical protein
MLFWPATFRERAPFGGIIPLEREAEREAKSPTREFLSLLSFVIEVSSSFRSPFVTFFWAKKTPEFEDTYGAAPSNALAG